MFITPDLEKWSCDLSTTALEGFCPRIYGALWSQSKYFEKMVTLVADEYAYELLIANDEHNEPDLDPLPFADITCPTLISHGLNDGAVPVEHARHVSEQITGAELILVEQGTHLLPAGRDFDATQERQLELTADNAD